ncbi:MAG: phytanoyl-CoA dioxygenase family protein [Nostoc sp.]|uniref:phytanoyl-CoA dioxygenase family protein n=1 Tax=Nostoc sp. TaxID=1180 RepID=UPI002FFA59B0
MKIKYDKLDTFLEQGYCSLGEVVNQQKCKELLEFIKTTRDFERDLFLEKEDFYAHPQYTGVNPCPGRNILEGLDLSFIEQNTVLQSLLSELLGEEYSVVIKKVICGVPKKWIPDWVISEIDKLPVPNLGAFIKPDYRDITYFHGIDFHQDIIDYKNRPSDFITLYIYLDDVSEVDSPLFIIPGSHIFGATTFPHSLIPHGDNSNGWLYSDRRGKSKLLQRHILTGSVGSAWFWHSCLLHGTQPTKLSQSRISLRYIIERYKSSSSVLLDYVNSNIDGHLSLENTRIDLNEDGKSILRGNIINGNAKT